jgi:hypothetical protein
VAPEAAEEPEVHVHDRAREAQKEVLPARRDMDELGARQPLGLGEAALGRRHGERVPHEIAAEVPREAMERVTFGHGPPMPLTSGRRAQGATEGGRRSGMSRLDFGPSDRSRVRVRYAAQGRPVSRARRSRLRRRGGPRREEADGTRPRHARPPGSARRSPRAERAHQGGRASYPEGIAREPLRQDDPRARFPGQGPQDPRRVARPRRGHRRVRRAHRSCLGLGHARPRRLGQRSGDAERERLQDRHDRGPPRAAQGLAHDEAVLLRHRARHHPGRSRGRPRATSAAPTSARPSASASTACSRGSR